MSDRTHLDELLAQADNNISRQLLEYFREMLRSPDVAASDYSAKLRAVMDEQLEALSDAAD
jgi:hypothetical protein